jgi:hypothetical protein
VLILLQPKFSPRLAGLKVKPLCQGVVLRTRAACNWVARVHPEKLQRRADNSAPPPGRSASAAHRCAHIDNHIMLAGISGAKSRTQTRMRNCGGNPYPRRGPAAKSAATLGVLEVVPDGGGSGFDASSRAERGIEWHGVAPAAGSPSTCPGALSLFLDAVAHRTYLARSHQRLPDDRPHHTHIIAFAPAPHRLDTHGSTHAGTRCRRIRITRRHARGRRRAVDRGDARAGGARLQQALREFRELNRKPQHRR